MNNMGSDIASNVLGTIGAVCWSVQVGKLHDLVSKVWSDRDFIDS